MTDLRKEFTASDIIHTHKNPIKAVGSYGKKIFIPENTEDEKNHIEDSLNRLYKILSNERVERRNNRIEAEWLPDINRAKVTKIVGHIYHYGYWKNGSLFLLPEEALFLLEMNRLELLYNGIPFSIEQGYMNLLGNETCTIHQYRVYQNLALQNFHVKYFTSDDNVPNVDEKLLKEKESPSSSIEEHSSSKKPKLDEDHEVENKDEMNCFNVYYSGSSVTKLKDKLKLQYDTDELTDDNISTDTSQKLNSLTGASSIAFYKLQNLDM